MFPVRNNRRNIAGEEISRFPKGEYEGIIKNEFLMVFFFEEFRIFRVLFSSLEQDRCSVGKLDHWAQLFDHIS